MIVIDTSAIVAFMNARDRHHERVAAWIDVETRELVTTPPVLAEVDHLVRTRGGAGAADALYEDLASGAYLVEWWPEAAAECAALARRHRDASLGLVDASLVLLAARVETVEIATLDERHFRAVRPLTGAPAFTLLPLDR